MADSDLSCVLLSFEVALMSAIVHLKKKKKKKKKVKELEEHGGGNGLQAKGGRVESKDQESSASCFCWKGILS